MTDSLQTALHLHQAGQLQQAENTYQQWLLQNHVEHANYAWCLYQLGLVSLQQGFSSQAQHHWRHALTLQTNPFWQVSLAAVCCDHGEFDEAERLCHAAASITPDIANTDFVLGEVARARGDLETAVKHYQRALTLQPEHLQAGAHLAAALEEMQRHDEALACYRMLRERHPGDAHIEHNYRLLMHRQLPAWHFPMLADHARNEAFERALQKAISPGTRVLDIGTGSGLLAMMAARAGATLVTACEMITPIADTARQVIARNGFSNINIINKVSTALQVGPQDDMTEKADLLVAEIVDAGLLGENILPSFRHAIKHLLQPEATIIPCGATVYAQLVDIPRLESVNPLRQISGFDLSDFDIFRAPGAPQLFDLRATPTLALSDIFPLCHFDFRNIPEAGTHALPDCTTNITNNGIVRAIVYWFTLHLDEEISISTALDSDVFCWQQSVQWFESPARVAQGQLLPLKISHNDRQLFFDLPITDQ